MIEKIKKRDGRLMDFSTGKITDALLRAGKASEEYGEAEAGILTMRILNIAQQLYQERYPTVEEIQDIVEAVLLNSIYKKTAKAYIIY